MLQGLEREDAKYGRKLIIQAILGTDMAKHTAMVEGLTVHAAESKSIPTVDAIETFLHMADLGNCVISWQLSKKYSCVAPHNTRLHTTPPSHSCPPTPRHPPPPPPPATDPRRTPHRTPPPHPPRHRTPSRRTPTALPSTIASAPIRSPCPPPPPPPSPPSPSSLQVGLPCL